MADKDLPSHELIPPHKILSKEKAEGVLSEFRVTRLQIPKIRIKDPALIGMGAKVGQMIEITRLDGSLYYRMVVE